MIAPNSLARKGDYGRIWGEEEGNADYGGKAQPSQLHLIEDLVIESSFNLTIHSLQFQYFIIQNRNKKKDGEGWKRKKEKQGNGVSHRNCILNKFLRKGALFESPSFGSWYSKNL